MAKSALHSAIRRYESIPPSAFPGGVRPPCFVDQAPINQTNNVLRPPYVIVSDRGSRTEYLSNGGVIETVILTVSVFATSLELVDRIAWAIRFGGQPPHQCAGFDFAVWPADPPCQCLQARPIKEQRNRVDWTHDAQPVYVVVMDYEILWSLII